MLPYTNMTHPLISSQVLTVHRALTSACKATVSISHIPHIVQVASPTFFTCCGLGEKLRLLCHFN